jgi:hypothetical protein
MRMISRWSGFDGGISSFIICRFRQGLTYVS